MGDAPKSAYEIAMEKLRMQDQERGESGPKALTDDQKREISEIRARFQAKQAEAEILHKANRRKAGEDAEALAKLEEEYAIDRRRIEEQREREIARVRGAGGQGPAGGPPTGRTRKGKRQGAACILVAALLALPGGVGSAGASRSGEMADAGTAATAGQERGAAPPVLVLRAARLFDGGEGDLRRDMAVVVEGERIRSVGPAASTPAPAGATILDLGDATLLPGLIDVHTHVLLQGDPTRRSYDDQVLKESIPHRTIRGVAAAKAALEHGFTTLRDLGSEGAGFADVALRDGILEGHVPGPRLFVSTLALDITGAYPLLGYSLESPVPNGVQVVDGPDAGRRAVREQVQRGADWIKVYCDRSYFIGADGRLDSIPTFDADELRAIVDEAHRQNRKVAAHAMAPKGLHRALEAGVDSIEHGVGLDAAAVRRMKALGVAYCPTLMVTRYVAPARAKEGAPVWERIPAIHESSFKAALAGGVTIVFGTDVGGFPWSLNEAEEFSWMVRFGMTPAKALRSATAIAARLLGQEQEVGRVATGLRADLVAVPGTPLQRIEAMQEVGFVMQRGRVVKNALAPVAGDPAPPASIAARR
jgi:imidazolonepropionase-like amidohydrolase